MLLERGDDNMAAHGGAVNIDAGWLPDGLAKVIEQGERIVDPRLGVVAVGAEAGGSPGEAQFDEMPAQWGRCGDEKRLVAVEAVSVHDEPAVPLVGDFDLVEGISKASRKRAGAGQRLKGRVR